MRENLEKCLVYMFGHEGGYVNDPKDSGGPTKYGVTWKTLRAYKGLKSTQKPTQADIEMVKALTLDEAENVYRANYWNQSGGDLLPAGVDFMAFDFGVNSGPATAVKKLQAVLKVNADGSVGVQTVNAINSYPGGVTALIKDYAEARLVYLKKLSGWSRYGNGWTKRVNKVKTQALGFVTGDEVPAAPTEQPVAKSPEPRPNPIINKENAAIVATVGSSLGGIIAGSGPLQWGLAVVVVLGGIMGAYYLFKRIRNS